MEIIGGLNMLRIPIEEYKEYEVLLRYIPDLSRDHAEMIKEYWSMVGD